MRKPNPGWVKAKENRVDFFCPASDYQKWKTAFENGGFIVTCVPSPNMNGWVRATAIKPNP
jgi:hypothetical protein